MVHWTLRYFPFLLVFFFNDTATTEIYTLSLHDALPISRASRLPNGGCASWSATKSAFSTVGTIAWNASSERSEEHTSELQSRPHLVCRLLLEKKKKETVSYHQSATRNNIQPATSYSLQE